MSRTKIVATYGPACESARTFLAMLRAGLDVVRLNVSHLEPEALGPAVARLRGIAARAGLPLAVLADMPGPKIRCTVCEPPEYELVAGTAVAVAAGRAASTPERIVVPYRHLLEDVKTGHEIAINDGLVLLRTDSVDRAAGALRCTVLRGGPVSSRKGVSFLHSTLRIQGLTPRDHAGIRAAARAGVDFIALSFVRSGRDVAAARRILARAGGKGLPLIAKIEQHEAIDHIDDILSAADGIMVARGDMGIERPLEQVPLLQKDIIRAANRAGKPVITATQMLESMITQSRPTRAEVTDVANAILDGTDAVMLSAETAIGGAPARVIRMMVRIATTAEPRIDSAAWLAGLDAPGPRPASTRARTAHRRGDPDLDDAVARATRLLASHAGLDAIVCLSFSGSTPRRIARYRPACPVFVLAPTEALCRRLALTWGVESFAFPLMSPGRVGKSPPAGELIDPALELLRHRRRLRKGDGVAFLAGVPLEVPGGTNYLRVVTVG